MLGEYRGHAVFLLLTEIGSYVDQHRTETTWTMQPTKGCESEFHYGVSHKRISVKEAMQIPGSQSCR